MWFSGIVVRFIFVLFLISSHLAEHYNTFFELSREKPEKRDHDWQQNLEAFTELVKRFSRPNIVVCDPFCGTGTTGVAALVNGCRFIRIDVDAKVLEVAQERLKALCISKPE